MRARDHRSMPRRARARRRAWPLVAVTALAVQVAACSEGGSSAPTTAAATSTGALPPETGPVASTSTSTTVARSTTTAPPAPAGWEVDTSSCADPAAATAPISGTVRVGSVMPLSGGVAAAALAPVVDGLRAYVERANATAALGDVRIELTILDDRYDPAQTSQRAGELLAAGVDVVTGIPGTAGNLAVREALNDACVPQLNALSGAREWSDVEAFPWTTGMLVPYAIETEVYAQQIQRMHLDGATAALVVADNEFGHAYADALRAVAARYGIEVVGEQLLDPAASTTPPTAQLEAAAALLPDVVLAAPVSAGCIGVLNELAASKVRHPGWMPDVFVTAACANGLIFAAAGSGAEGVHTSDNLRDLSDPAAAGADPAVRAYLDAMAARGASATVGPAAVGWTLGEITVATLAQAAASPDGLTRASVIEAARALRITPSLARPGLVHVTDGVADPDLAQSLQVVRWQAPTPNGPGRFVDVGELVTTFETPPSDG